MSALVCRFPEENLHLADLPYRFSSWAFDDPANINLWFTEHGEFLAWAALQAPFWTIDYAFDPGARLDLHRLILEWAGERARRAAGSVHGRPSWYVMAFAGQTDRIHDLETAIPPCCSTNPWASRWRSKCWYFAMIIPAGRSKPFPCLKSHPSPTK